MNLALEGNGISTQVNFAQDRAHNVLDMLTGTAFLDALKKLFPDQAGSTKTLQFAGRTWAVRSGVGNPQSNHWSATDQNVRVDDSGHLHLRQTKSHDTWCAVEIQTQEALGLGVY